MSEQSVTLKTVTAAAFIEDGERKTPRLSVVVRYTKGGTSYLDGKSYSRGFEISVCHDRLSDTGTKSVVIDGKGDPTQHVELASRFSPAKLTRIVTDACNGKYDDIITKLYARAVSNRSEYVWAESIFPISNTAAE
jgi:hypothetical protein